MSVERAAHQASPLPSFNSWAADDSSRWWLEHQLSRDNQMLTTNYLELLDRVGQRVGSVELRSAADRASRNEPSIISWDAYGNRCDDVEYDSSWHTCLTEMTSSGVCALPWIDEQTGYLIRTALVEQWARIDIGVMCPVTMTSAAMPILRRDSSGPGFALARDIQHAAQSGIEAGSIDGHAGRNGRHPIIGMAMTEPQGGSDLSRSSTQATARGDGTFTLNGHKWFVSHPTADAFLILARDPEVSATGNDGLSCFLASGWREDGSHNGFELQRLKDKLGTRSLASAEVILRDTYATRVGEPGRGIATIIEMVVHTRMDCAIGSAGLMARAVAETVHYARKREAFGAVLEAQPQMRTVLADIVLEREASLALAYEVALQFQQGNAIGRLMTAVAKYWITRRAVAVAIECVESLGGNGYTEELPLARLYRDAQVNSTWEGAGNVMALDVLRTLTKQPQLMGELIAHVADLVADAPLQLARDVASLCADINPPTSQADGRRFAGEVAVTLQAALLAHRAGATGHDSDAHIARAFIATRCHGRGVHIFGANASALDEAADALIDRAPLPHAPAA